MSGLTSKDNFTIPFFLGEVWPLIELTLFVWQTLPKQAKTATVPHYQHPELVPDPNHVLPRLPPVGCHPLSSHTPISSGLYLVGAVYILEWQKHVFYNQDIEEEKVILA